jgi:phosphomannomutase
MAEIFKANDNEVVRAFKNPQIFKAYDIRGIYPSELDEEIVYKIGKAYVQLTQAKTIVVGQDMRTSSPALFEALTRGITEMGANVISIGPCTTPMFYFTVTQLNADAGMMITASHNPAQYNGIKMVKEGAKPFGGQEIQEIKKLVEHNNFQTAEKGTITKQELLKDYIQKLKTFANINKELKIVIDTGNGMCGLTVPKLFQELPLKTTYLYKAIDLTYPNHEANPLKTETLKDLQEEVKKQKADIGIAFDGDGDRVGFVDESGEIVPMDLVGGLIATELLKKNPNATILYDIRSSHAVPEEIKKSFGKPVKTRVGHFFIKQKMREIDALFASELSGHYYFKDLSHTDSGIAAVLKVLNLLASSQKTFSELMQPFKKYHKTDEMNFEVQNKDEKIKQIEQKYPDAKKDHTDGITIEYDDWWCNVRKSNTEPLLRLNLEANTKELMKEKVKEIEEVITGN